MKEIKLGCAEYRGDKHGIAQKTPYATFMVRGYRITHYWILSVQYCEKEINFFTYTSTYIEDTDCFSPCGAAGAYDWPPTLASIKSFSPEEVKAFKTKQCKEKELGSGNGEKTLNPFIFCDDGDLIMLFYYDEEKKKKLEKEDNPFRLATIESISLFPKFKSDKDDGIGEMTKAGYFPLGILKVEDWKQLLHWSAR